ncbi:MAG TPA: 3-hydroxyacyl-CoA dehydrogenase family protein [Thermoplasmata archaeon]|nr:3-hydroxyacyl-CoA dehydrogenase family protein [Thermoplasmata archaeon]
MTPGASAESDPRESVRKRVLVVGAGIMGSGVAAQAALAGYPVTLVDVNEEFARRGRENASRALDHAVRKGTVSVGDREAALGRLDVGIGLRRADSAQVIVEAAPENLELKRKVFAEIEEYAAPEALLASNTSSLPITAIGEHLKDPTRLVGIHFFNPVLQMPLVELIPGHTTPPEVVERARTFAVSLGKTVVLSRDSPGFVTSRGMAVLVNEATWMLYEGVATKEDIDTSYKLGFHHPMGPFELVDLVGIDTTLAILDVLWDGFRDPRYRACPLLRTMVSAHKLGRKTGEGFYPYPAPGAPP